MNLVNFYCEWLMDVDARERLAEVIRHARGKLSQRLIQVAASRLVEMGGESE